MDDFMQYAIQQSGIALSYKEVPVGAVIVRNRQIIATAHNMTLHTKDPTAHAEMLVLKKAANAIDHHRLDECDLYVTLEPCAMCAYAISLARIRRLYFGAYDRKSGGVENGACIYSHSSTHHRPEVYGGIKERETQQIIQDFFKMLRA